MAGEAVLWRRALRKLMTEQPLTLLGILLGFCGLGIIGRELAPIATAETLWRVMTPVAMVCFGLLVTIVSVLRQLRQSESDKVALKRMRHALRTQRAELETLRDGFPLGLFLLSPNDKLTYVNERLCAQLSMPRTEMLRGGWINALSERARDEILGSWKESIGDARQFESVVPVDRDGRTRWIQIRTVPIRREGRLIGFMGVSIEMDERMERDTFIRDHLIRIEGGQESHAQCLSLIEERIMQLADFRSDLAETLQQLLRANEARLKTEEAVAREADPNDRQTPLNQQSHPTVVAEIPTMLSLYPSTATAPAAVPDPNDSQRKEKSTVSRVLQSLLTSIVLPNTR